MKKDIVTSRFTRLLVPLYGFGALILMYAAACGLDGIPLFAVCLLPAVIWGTVCLIFVIKKRMNTNSIIIFIMLLALCVRVCYIIKTPWYARQHDVFSVTEQGHSGYIYTIFSTGRLPQSNEGLFYHPPLHHFLGAMFLRLCRPFYADTDQMLEMLQILTAYYSYLCAWVFLRITETLKIKKYTALTVFAYIALHPTLIILSGSINNDMLCLLLSSAAVLYMLRWIKEQSFANSLLMGLFLGCAMMTKLSAVLLAPVIGGVFVYRLIKPVKIERKRVFAHELSFAALSIPLGMWYPVRNLVQFAQPFGYVMRIDDTHPLYCGDHSIASRFLPILNADTLASPYCDAFNDYNVPLYALKCACFGEFSFSFPTWIGWLLVFLQGVIFALGCVSAVVLIIKKKRMCQSLALTGVCVFNIISYVFFNIAYPHGCSMDFRYLLPCLICSAALTALLLEGAKKKIKAAAICLLCSFFSLSTVLFMSGAVTTY